MAKHISQITGWYEISRRMLKISWRCWIRMPSFGVSFRKGSTWWNILKRKFGDSRRPLDDRSNVRLRLGLCGAVLLATYPIFNLMSSETWRHGYNTQIQHKRTHNARLVRPSNIGFQLHRRRTNLSVASVLNIMVKHHRCEWYIIVVLHTQDFRVFRECYRNTHHVGLNTQLPNIDILTKHHPWFHPYHGRT